MDASKNWIAARTFSLWAWIRGGSFDYAGYRPLLQAARAGVVRLGVRGGFGLGQQAAFSEERRFEEID